MPRKKIPKRTSQRPARLSQKASPSPSHPVLSIEPDRAAKRKALLTVVSLVIVLGAFGAILDLWIAPMLTYPANLSSPPQTITMAALDNRFEPNVFTIEVNRSVHWVIDATRASGCANTLIIPDLDRRVLLVHNATVIDFTPPARGKIPFSCANGTAQGYFVVE